MINYMIKHYFCLNYKKWIYTFVALHILGIVIKYIAPGIYLPKGTTLVFFDYLFIYLSFPLVIILVLPIIYCYLIGDIITRDFKSGYIELLLPRISNRITYFISKVAIVYITSNLLFLCCLVNIIIVSFLYKIPFKGKCYYEVVTCSIKSGGSIITTLIQQYGLFIITFSALGLFILIISLIFNNSVYSFIGVILLVLQGRNSVFDDHSKMFFSPIAQGILSLHSPFYFYGSSNKIDANFENFTVSYSMKYLWVMLLLLFVIGCFRIRNMNIARKD
ncbi:hypothetical protein LGK95_08350 [Clostridium algoriphilum]|uniref:hypothetical protein n=1 Tax=Clostridium algoriphilum TaxID=198347 RepID=UPI001CF282FA|nr:hypothetical protein [Clostridium algoriphilum]MCB2293530.1 hypothetical protein [Clostridium algoriphilum]